MVAYFRSFEPSDDFPNDHGDIYLDLALSRKGVCRHRAFAFLVTALNIGVPTRFVANEAHAWVEVHDSRLWHTCLRRTPTRGRPAATRGKTWPTASAKLRCAR